MLAGVDAVGPGNGLHQGVVAHRLVEVERRAGGRIKAGEPHGAHEHQPQRISGVLEAGIQRRIGAGEPAAVGFDVEAQGRHVSDLILGGRDDHGHVGAGEDVKLPPQLRCCIEVVVQLQQGGSLSAAGAGCWIRRQLLHQGTHPLGFLLPIALHLVVHPQGGGLVDRDHHRLAHEAPAKEVAHDVAGNRLQPVVPGDDVVLPAQLPFELLLLLAVEVGRLNRRINIVVEIGVDQL